MKAINKNTITVLIIIFAGFFLTICDSCKPEPKPLKYLYIPDSLKFPMQTGDTAVFMVRNDSIRYDTAVIAVKDTMDAYVTYEYGFIGYSQSISVIYSFNDEKKSRLVITEEYQRTIENIQKYLFFEYYNKSNNSYLCHVSNIKLSIYNNNISIENIVYNNVIYSEKCEFYTGECYFIDIYRNIENGLISFTNTNSQDTFVLNKYIIIK